MDGGEVWDSMCVSDKDELQTERSLSAIAALVKVYKHTERKTTAAWPHFTLTENRT